MEKDRISPLSTAARLRRKFFQRRGNTTTPAGLRLAAVEVTVPADPDLLTPGMRVALVEDTCWALANEWWSARRPPRWQPRERAAWNAGRKRLDAKRARVRELVEAELGR